MDWVDLLKGPLASAPVAAVLAFGCYKLWEKCEDKDKIILDKDLQIKALNEARVSDLKAIAKQND